MILKLDVELDDADASLASRVIKEALASYILDLTQNYRQLTADADANEHITSRIAVATSLKKAVTHVG